MDQVVNVGFPLTLDTSFDLVEPSLENGMDGLLDVAPFLQSKINEQYKCVKHIYH